MPCFCLWTCQTALFNLLTVSHHIHTAAYLSSFWKLWSPSSRSRKRKRSGSGGTSLSSCSILRVEMSKITSLLLLLVWSGAGAELEEVEEQTGSEREKKRRSGKAEGMWRTGNSEKGKRRTGKRRGSRARKHGMRDMGQVVDWYIRQTNRKEIKTLRILAQFRKSSALSFGDRPGYEPLNQSAACSVKMRRS